MKSSSQEPFQSFQEFWPFYLGEHANPQNRRLHFVGTSLVFLILILAISSDHWPWLWAIPVAGYGFAWVGHFIVEKNRPATFQHPLWSLRGDFKMFFMTLSGRLPEELKKYNLTGSKDD